MKTVFIFLILVTALIAQSDHWKTYYEKSNFKETSRYSETIEFARKLASGSPWIQYTSFGKSPQGRDLPLLIVDKNGNFTAKEVHQTSNAVFLIQAGIHAGEIDGKDAGFMLIREIAITKKLESLLDHVTLLFIPIFSVDGHERFSAYNRANQNGPEEMGWRTTAQNLNLNRDYLKADAPEMQAWLKLYNEWLPEFFADCHVTDGADYQYPITYKIERHGIQNRGIIDWVEQEYLPPLLKAMEKDGFPTNEYVTFQKAHDVLSGLGTWATPPRLSDRYTAIQNRPGLLIETHMFKDYKTRVDATYAMLKHTVDLLNEHHIQLNQLIVKADSMTALPSFREDSLALRYQTGNDSVMVDFLGYEYLKINSDLSGGDWYRYSDKPKIFDVPFYNQMEPSVQVKLPEAYIVPAEWQQVIGRIRLHGVDFYELKTAHILNIPTYRFTEAKWRERPYESRHPVTVKMESLIFKRTYSPGSILIDMNQRTAKVIANILEPLAPDSYIYWGFFDSIFEQKEYVESYVMEERARMMLASDEDLKKEFEEKRRNDTEFANNPRAILNWFYQKSPYWDKMKDVYPVGRIFDRELIERLKGE